MMLCKLSFKNIRKSIKDYTIYFFTLILGVAIFYVFNAIGSQTAMLDISSRTDEIITLMTEILSGVSVFVSIILAFLVIYASRFLMKRRNKEFVIYLTLGMSKRKISLILFFETLFIGIISLTVGLAIGVLLSQLMSIVVANMFKVEMHDFTFIFSQSACIKTLIYFGIMYLIVMIFNTISINRYKLIDLLHSSKKSEMVKLKNPIICMLIFIVSVCVLSYAYYIVSFGIDKINDGLSILSLMAAGAISTFFIFWSLSGLILKIVKKNKKFYYKNLNSFVIKQISSKINTTVFSMSVICLMLFVTICVLSSSLSMKKSLNKVLTDYVPRDIEVSKPVSFEEYYSDTQINNSKLSIKDSFSNLGFDYKKYLKNTILFSLYIDDDITLKSTLGSYYDTAYKNYKYLRYDDNVFMMMNSDYNKVAEVFNLDKVYLNDNEYVLVGNFKNMIQLKEGALKKNTKLTIDNRVYYPKYKKAIYGFYEMASNEVETGFLVLPDEALLNAQKKRNYIIADYNGNKDNVEDMINKLIQRKDFTDNLLTVNTKKDIQNSSVGLGAIVVFIGLYLGIIFLISCAAILALKELSESSDNKERFQMLRRIGVSEADLNKALFKQIGIFFLFPLILAIVHSIFGLIFCNVILKDMGVDFDIISVIVTAIFIILIYGGYLIITYFCSKNIIKEVR